MMSHPEPVDEGFKIISHDLEAETVLIRHGQSFHDLPIHQGPEGWAIFEYEKKQHTMYDLPSLAINGKHGPLVMQEASTSMGSTDAWNPEVGEAQVDDSEDLIAEQLQELSQMWYPTPPAKHDDGAIGVIDLLTKVKEEQNTSPMHLVQQPLGASHPILNLAPLVPAQSLQPAPPTPNPAVGSESTPQQVASVAKATTPKMAVMKKPSCLKRPGGSKPAGYGTDIYRAMWYTRGHIALRYKSKTGQQKQFASASCTNRVLAWKIAQQAIGKLRAGTLDVADAKKFLKDNLKKQ